MQSEYCTHMQCIDFLISYSIESIISKKVRVSFLSYKIERLKIYV